ncbi:IS4 family transposase [Actinomadura sp. HBU206391]|uniref:IS4 family transposase n=1 Tax=Actinomadura sp. HBU206391 TaxID=2731692 RepID=UPI001C9BEA76|nr:IS4 family transposase [Actinomadura sp. HBU206391]
MSGGTAGLRARLGVLTVVFTPELVDEVIAEHGRVERRRRLLPSRLVVYFVLALCLFARESYEEVIRLLTSGLPGSRALVQINRSSLYRARARLGDQVLETLFRQVAGPLATPGTPGAWWRGLRLLALDGTQFDVPDSVGNGQTFDGPSTGGTPFGFPQVRSVVLSEIGTHGVLDAAVGGYRDGERGLALELTGAIGPGDLVIADRGFWSAELVAAFTATGADLLIRLQSNHRGTTVSELADGSCLSTSQPSKQVRRRAKAAERVLPERITFRVISFAAGDSMLHLGTTLTDPERFPADELIALYRQRWEIELAFDELKNHLGTGGPLRSRTPEGVRQEIWAYLAVHHAVRRLAHDAAASTGPQVDSDRISYLKCVRIIRTSVTPQAGATPAKLTRALVQAVHEARHRLLAPRSGRRCPRAIKKPNRWPILRTRAGRDQVDPGRHANSPTAKVKPDRRAGRPFISGAHPTPPPLR